MDDHRQNIIDWRIRVASEPIRVTVIRVALALGSRFGLDGSVAISRPDLAAAAGVSETTVRSALRQLIDEGWVDVSSTVSDEGDLGPNLYTYALPPETATAPPSVEDAGPSTQGGDVSPDERTANDADEEAPEGD
jgi:hypothetical protein